jgi:predicted component of type VI protein secretion system
MASAAAMAAASSGTGERAHPFAPISAIAATSPEAASPSLHAAIPRAAMAAILRARGIRAPRGPSAAMRATPRAAGAHVRSSTSLLLRSW